jgi:nucleoside-diphosphate-sugar epimerase
VADALDAGAVRQAIEQARPEVVINELTDLDRPLNPRKYAEWLEGTNRLRKEGTRNLVDGARAAGVRRFISQSVAFAYDFQQGTKTEGSPLMGAEGGEMSGAIRELEQQTLAAPEGIVLRYGFFYGPGTSYDAGGQQIAMIKRRQMPIVGGGKGSFPFIHVDDAASATAAAVDHGTPGVYNVVDDEPAPVAEWLPVLADRLGAKPPMRVPRFVGRLAAGEAGVALMTEIRGASNAKAKRELGWRPAHATWREGFAA